ncbi:MAG TPA: DUF4136 domain-containing protein [Terriglobales bacterium]|nr:DUF4136 domain-containing protein [Terriglobales bacterium]
MKRFFVLAIIMFLLTAGISLAQDVRYNFDKGTDFSKFKTYKWAPIQGTSTVSDMVDKQIKGAIDAELATKGLIKVDGDDANLDISYESAINTEQQFTSFSTDSGFGSGWGYGPGWGYRYGWGYGPAYYGWMGSSTTTGWTSTIYTGQLTLNMYDSAGQDLVWRGVVSKTLDLKAKPEKQQKNLAKAVRKLLKHYPPSVKR